MFRQAKIIFLLMALATTALAQKKSGIETFTLKNKKGMEAKFISYGATLISLKVPDKNGKFADVVQGYDDLDGYVNGRAYIGCIVGRYANRIAGARFTLDGKEYRLAANDGKNHLHGGLKGFDKVNWKGKRIENSKADCVVFTYSSPAGDQNYPGNLNAKVTYNLNENNELRITYQATTDKKTIVNMTNHSYFNLAGQGSGDILGHILMINADFYTPVDKNCLPTGEIAKVAGSDFDFTKPMAIGSRIKNVGGYDNNFVLNKSFPGRYTLAAKVVDPVSGRVMEVFTTEPGMQLYASNSDNEMKGKNGAVYKKYSAFCLEAQHFPDSPNRPYFPSVILQPKEVYQQVTVYKFSVQ
jgi:aldose 1-epimerase